MLYIKVKHKFAITLCLSLLFSVVCSLISVPWFRDIREYTGGFFAALIIGGVAIVPGFINFFLLANTLLDRQKYSHELYPAQPVTLIIAAYNEGQRLLNTLNYVAAQDYPGPMTVIVADNNSTDNTRELVQAASSRFPFSLRYVFEPRQGKHFALNTALALVETPYLITLDADTLLHRKAVRYLCARLLHNPDVAAVAGAVMAKNSRVNLLTKMQEWDYFLSMSAIKKMQGIYQGTLVAQGAFSVYRTDRVREVGGWSDSTGEDIVLTWNFLKRNYKVYYEPLAVCFTDVPEKLSHFAKQRCRWARGMIEGFRAVKPTQQPNLYYRFLTLIDVAIIYIDFSYTFFFIPGLILFCFGVDLIVSKMALLVLPFTLLTFVILCQAQRKRVFDALELQVRSNPLGFVCFLLCYQLLMSPISLWGYMQEFTRRKRVWK